MFDGGKIGGRVAGADAAFVVAEDHIHDPVQAVLYRPMLANDGAKLLGGVGQGCDVEAGFGLGFGPGFARAFEHDDAVQPRPVVALAQASPRHG